MRRHAFAIVAVVLAFAMPARAQSPDWQTYKPDNGGFSVDMPGKPTLNSETRNGRQNWSATVGIDKATAGTDLVFLVKYQEGGSPPGPDTEAKLDEVVKAMAEGGKLLSVQKETLAGFPSRRFSIEDADKDTYQVRNVVTDKNFIQAIFLGPPDNALGKRFLDSFTMTKP